MLKRITSGIVRNVFLVTLFSAQPLPIGACLAGESTVADLAAGFVNPGNEARPRAYWNWLNGDVSLPVLTRDLEEAKAKGLGGLDMWDTEAMDNPGGVVPSGPTFMGPESVAAMQHCIKDAKRLGLDLGLIASSGWNAGGAWVPPELASKNLFVSFEVVAGPGDIMRKLAFPKVSPECPMGADGLPKWWMDVAVLAWPDTPDMVIRDPAHVVNLTDQVKNGELRWIAPKGVWRVARFVCSNNGQQLIAASPNSKGLFIDFLDPAATRYHFRYFMDKLGLRKGGDPACPLKHLAVDSMELHQGIQWTPKFPEWFRQYRGYAPEAWLPVLVKWTIKDKETSDRFQYDYRKTVSDLLIFSHYTTGSEVCRGYGLELAGEAGGPGPPIWNTCPVDALKALGNVDIPRGEFWIRHRNMFLVKEIASAAHIYGKPYADAESWTTWRRWKDCPNVLKVLVDRAFCEGLNRVTYHGYCHSPPEAGYPGRGYHAGMDINPQVVWWPKARPFMDYLARCCHMLQRGLFVADVAYYYGDQAPNFWPLVHDVPEKPLLPGLGAGYDYDVVNSDVILSRMSVKAGRIVFPDGMSYRILVLPEQRDMPLEVLEKLERLVSAGATVIGRKPSEVPGLQDREKRTAELRALADRMWGACDGASVKQNSYGKGRIVCGMSARQLLEKDSIRPDFECLDANHASALDYIHRKTGDADIYFVRNASQKPVSADCRFRVEKGAPSLWDPADGSMVSLLVCETVDGGIRVRLDLPQGGSAFVVFDRKSLVTGVRTLMAAAKDASLPPAKVVALGDNTATVQCWQNGEYRLTDGKGRQLRASVKQLPPPLVLESDWSVAFDPKWGAPAEAKFPKLISWTDHEHQGIKYYSGTGSYTKTMNITADWLADGRRVCLDLGDVRELAEVFVNGQSAGVLWKAPYVADITALAKPGANHLKIEVMNSWMNRLSGDMKRTPEERFCRTNVIPNQDSRFFRYQHGDEAWHIQPAGLLGPVRLLTSVTARMSVPEPGCSLVGIAAVKETMEADFFDPSDLANRTPGVIGWLPSSNTRRVVRRRKRLRAAEGPDPVSLNNRKSHEEKQYEND
jgi:hypothetical protein